MFTDYDIAADLSVAVPMAITAIVGMIVPYVLAYGWRILRWCFAKRETSPHFRRIMEVIDSVTPRVDPAESRWVWYEWKTSIEGVMRIDTESMRSPFVDLTMYKQTTILDSFLTDWEKRKIFKRIQSVKERVREAEKAAMAEKSYQNLTMLMNS